MSDIFERAASDIVIAAINAGLLTLPANQKTPEKQPEVIAAAYNTVYTSVKSADK